MDVLSCQEWLLLTEEEKLIEFNNIKNAAGIYNKNGIEYIVRPLLPLGEYWSSFKTLLQRDFPNGEEREFHNKPATFNNYKLLVNWLQGKCFCCGSSELCWDEGDKSILTYCHNCREERFFSRVDWLDARLVEQ
jgi:hypothetical protein